MKSNKRWNQTEKWWQLISIDTMSKDRASLPSSAPKPAEANSVTNAALIWNPNNVFFLYHFFYSLENNKQMPQMPLSIWNPSNLVFVISSTTL